VLGCLVVYAALSGTGYLLYGRAALGGLFLAVASLAAIALLRTLPAVGFE